MRRIASDLAFDELPGADELLGTWQEAYELWQQLRLDEADRLHRQLSRMEARADHVGAASQTGPAIGQDN